MQDAREEIKARLPIEDVIGQYIELKRAGRNLKGRSPWGVDKTPSFMVSPEKQIWHDFSANKGGDVFSFIMEVEGISFREALEKLAMQAGVQLEKYSGGDGVVTKRKARAREALEWACKYYQVCLSKNRGVCEYVFYKRNMNRGTVGEFRIGYAPSGKDYLAQFLKRKGFTAAELQDAGLLNQYGGDMFRGRMMIPFMEASSGAVIGFTARVIEGGEPKYLNTPETLLFNKSRFVFGLAQAKEAIRRSGFVVIVEGNMDVISSHQAGVKEAVATSGTAMTEQHLKILARLTSDIRLAYDGDEAGVRAAERAVDLAGKQGINLSVISGYGTAKDPDELIQQGAEKWRACVEQREPAVDWLLRKYEESLDLNSGPGKREYSDMAMRVIGYLQDPVERKHYEQVVARRLEVSVEDLRAKKIGGETRRLKPVKTGEAVAGAAERRVRMLEDNLAAIMLYGGAAGQGIGLEVPEDEGRLNELSLVYEERYGGRSEAEVGAEAAELWKQYTVERRRAQVAELSAKLAAEEDEEEKRKILREIQRVQRG